MPSYPSVVVCACSSTMGTAAYSRTPAVAGGGTKTRGLNPSRTRIAKPLSARLTLFLELSPLKLLTPAVPYIGGPVKYNVRQTSNGIGSLIDTSRHKFLCGASRHYAAHTLAVSWRVS